MWDQASCQARCIVKFSFDTHSTDLAIVGLQSEKKCGSLDVISKWIRS